jgi:hypothetical protein
MMRMRLPQHGQGCSGAFGSSGFVVAALMASIGRSGTASSSRIRAMLLAQVGREPIDVSHVVEFPCHHRFARELKARGSAPLEADVSVRASPS